MTETRETARPQEQSVVESLLYRESRLIDEGKLDEWLELFTDDATYWIPCEPDSDPEQRVSIVFDDRSRLEDRVWRLGSGLAYSQDPPSRTCHLVSNVEIEALSAEELIAMSALVVIEHRHGVQTIYAARCRHALRLVDGSWRIASKKVALLNSDEPLGNLSFIV